MNAVVSSEPVAPAASRHATSPFKPQLVRITSKMHVRSTGTTPGAAQDAPVVTISFQVHEAHAPALRSAVEEISNEIGGRLEGMYRYDQEEALTAAAVALGTLRAAVDALVPAGDPNYRGRR